MRSSRITVSGARERTRRIAGWTREDDFASRHPPAASVVPSDPPDSAADKPARSSDEEVEPVSPMIPADLGRKITRLQQTCDSRGTSRVVRRTTPAAAGTRRRVRMRRRCRASRSAPHPLHHLRRLILAEVGADAEVLGADHFGGAGHHGAEIHERAAAAATQMLGIEAEAQHPAAPAERPQHRIGLVARDRMPSMRIGVGDGDRAARTARSPPSSNGQPNATCRSPCPTRFISRITSRPIRVMPGSSAS